MNDRNWEPLADGFYEKAPFLIRLQKLIDGVNRYRWHKLKPPVKPVDFGGYAFRENDVRYELNSGESVLKVDFTAEIEDDRDKVFQIIYLLANFPVQVLISNKSIRLEDISDRLDNWIGAVIKCDAGMHLPQKKHEPRETSVQKADRPEETPAGGKGQSAQTPIKKEQVPPWLNFHYAKTKQARSEVNWNSWLCTTAERHFQKLVHDFLRSNYYLKDHPELREIDFARSPFRKEDAEVALDLYGYGARYRVKFNARIEDPLEKTAFLMCLCKAFFDSPREIWCNEEVPYAELITHQNRRPSPYFPSVIEGAVIPIKVKPNLNPSQTPDRSDWPETWEPVPGGYFAREEFLDRLAEKIEYCEQYAGIWEEYVRFSFQSDNIEYRFDEEKRQLLVRSNGKISDRDEELFQLIYLLANFPARMICFNGMLVLERYRSLDAVVSYEYGLNLAAGPEHEIFPVDEYWSSPNDYALLVWKDGQYLLKVTTGDRVSTGTVYTKPQSGWFVDGIPQVELIRQWLRDK